jgi:hypothetical protein
MFYHFRILNGILSRKLRKFYMRLLGTVGGTMTGMVSYRKLRQMRLR